jgi:hypothetical protein
MLSILLTDITEALFQFLIGRLAIAKLARTWQGKEGFNSS